MIPPHHIEELSKIPGVTMKSGVEGRRLTTYFIGGPVTLLEVEDKSALLSLSRLLSNGEVPWRALGAGSNVLISDKGLSGVTIRLGRGFREVGSLGGGRFQVGGAASLMTLCRDLSEGGFAGLEFAGGIPATFGGAVRMNAGAHGGEIWGVLEEVSVALKGEEVKFKQDEVSFSYRRSGLPADCIILGGVLRLKESSREVTSNRRAEYLAERKRRQPLTAPSAGSVFKNPEPDRTAGMLIEQSGLKGFKIGGAVVSELHANWIINPEKNATASDVQRVIGECQERVREKFGVHLEQEVISWE